MRRWQKEYFKTRSHVALEKSKVIEREIDKEIKRVQDIEAVNKPPEPNLFNQ